jgi:hypothetical protein
LTRPCILFAIQCRCQLQLSALLPVFLSIFTLIEHISVQFEFGHLIVWGSQNDRLGAHPQSGAATSTHNLGSTVWMVCSLRVVSLGTPWTCFADVLCHEGKESEIQTSEVGLVDGTTVQCVILKLCPCYSVYLIKYNLKKLV